MAKITQADVTEILSDFIYKTFPMARKKAVGPTDHIIDEGVVDSLGLLTIVDFIETKFRIIISDEDMDEKSFDSIKKMTDLILRYTS